MIHSVMETEFSFGERTEEIKRHRQIHESPRK